MLQFNSWWNRVLTVPIVNSSEWWFEDRCSYLSLVAKWATWHAVQSTKAPSVVAVLHLGPLIHPLSDGDKWPEYSIKEVHVSMGVPTDDAHAQRLSGENCLALVNDSSCAFSLALNGNPPNQGGWMVRWSPCVVFVYDRDVFHSSMKSSWHNSRDRHKMGLCSNWLKKSYVVTVSKYVGGRSGIEGGGRRTRLSQEIHAMFPPAFMKPDEWRN